ncbi:MAG TPA: hypothetical protein VEQ60_29095, partial [Longimicrobium sp.]|nr:hypothetical protein [Longimicrobium sp.]
MEFAALSDLWEPRVTRDEVLQYAESNSERADYLYELGVCISHLHLQNILPDSSESNFIRGRDGVKLIDYGGIRMDAHTDADYAKNLLPFLLGFTRPEWEIFKRGYLSESYAHSGQVIEYIEAGEARPWIRSIAEGRYEDAALQLRTHLDSSSGMEVDEEVGLRSE